MSTTPATKGLEGVVAATSSICFIDGEKGILAYRGIDIHELAQHSTFEEVCYLLWFGKLPTAKELADFQAQLGAERKLQSGHHQAFEGPSHQCAAYGSFAHGGLCAEYV